MAIFDGEILEIFGAQSWASGENYESMRFHREVMSITLESGRGGDLEVDVYAAAVPHRRVPSSHVKISAQDRPVIDFFERVRAALPPA